MIGASQVGTPMITVTSGRGHTPEELAHMCRNKIVSIGPSAHPAIRQQAEAYADQIERMIAKYMRQAVKSDRTTIYNALVDAGHPELAKAIVEI